jgi:hypothetical protein
MNGSTCDVDMETDELHTGPAQARGSQQEDSDHIPKQTVDDSDVHDP